MPRILAVLLATVALAACSSHVPAGTAASAAPASASTNALAGTPLAVYGHDLNKARHVQNVVNAEAKRQAQAINAATGSSTH